MSQSLRSKPGQDEAQALLSLAKRAEHVADYWRDRASGLNEVPVGYETGRCQDEIGVGNQPDYWLERFYEAAEMLASIRGDSTTSLDLSTRQPELFASRLVARSSTAVEAFDIPALRERATSQVAAAVASLADVGAASLRDLEEAVSLIHEEILRETVSQAVSHVRRQMVSDVVRYLIPRLREPKGTR